MALDLSAELYQHRTVLAWPALTRAVAHVDLGVVFLMASRFISSVYP